MNYQINYSSNLFRKIEDKPNILTILIHLVKNVQYRDSTNLKKFESSIPKLDSCGLKRNQRDYAVNELCRFGVIQRTTFGIVKFQPWQDLILFEEQQKAVDKYNFETSARYETEYNPENRRYKQWTLPKCLDPESEEHVNSFIAWIDYRDAQNLTTSQKVLESDFADLVSTLTAINSIDSGEEGGKSHNIWNVYAAVKHCIQNKTSHLKNFSPKPQRVSAKSNSNDRINGNTSATNQSLPVVGHNLQGSAEYRQVLDTFFNRARQASRFHNKDEKADIINTLHLKIITKHSAVDLEILEHACRNVSKPESATYKQILSLYTRELNRLKGEHENKKLAKQQESLDIERSEFIKMIESDKDLYSDLYEKLDDNFKAIFNEMSENQKIVHLADFLMTESKVGA